MRQIEISKLSVRPFPVQDEGVNWYLMRLANCNGLDRIGYRLVSARRPTIQELAALLDRDDHAIWATHPEKDFWYNSTSKNNVVWNWQIRKCCPACLKENQYGRVEWELRHMTTCSIHRTKLIDTCPNCHKQLKWQSHELARCQCEYDLRTATMEPSDDHEVLLAQAYKATLGLCELPPKLAFISHLNTRELVLLTQYLGKLGVKDGSVKRIEERRLEAISPVYFHASNILANWPERYHQHLNELNIGNEQVAESISLLDVFGKAYTELYAGLKSETFRFVRKEFEQHIQNNWRWSMSNRNKRMSKDTRLSGMWMPAAQAAKQMQVRVNSIAQQVERGEMEGRTFITASGRVHLVVFVRDVEQTKEARKGFLNLMETCDALGLSENRVIELIKAKIIRVPRIANNYSKWRIPKGELDKLLDLAKAAPEVTEYTKVGVPIKNLLKSGLRGAFAFPDFIKEIVAGAITVDQRILGSNGLSGWVINKERYDDWLECQTELEDCSYSIQQVAAVLRTKEEVAYSLVKRGLLKAQSDQRNGRPIMKVYGDEIVRFKQRYVFSSQLAEQINTSPRSLISKFAALGEFPYLKIGAGGFRQAIFEKTAKFKLCWITIAEHRA